MLLGFLVPYRVPRVEKIWKSQGIQSGQGNVRGNCFRPNPIRQS